MSKPNYEGTIRRVGWTGGLLLVAVLVISAIEQKQATRVSTLDIAIEPLEDSTLLIQQGDIMLALDRAFGYRFDEKSIKELDVRRIESVLEKEPFILDADVYIDAVNILKIGVKQREPVIRIIDKNGLNYYLDKDGFKMPLSRHYTTSVLVATGNIPPHVPDFQERRGHVLRALFELTQFIREDPFLLAFIEQIYITNTGDFVFIPNVGDQKIIFGSLEDKEKKFRNLKVFYEEAFPVQGWRKYSTINLKYKGQVVCH